MNIRRSLRDKGYISRYDTEELLALLALLSWLNPKFRDSILEGTGFFAYRESPRKTGRMEAPDGY